MSFVLHLMDAPDVFDTPGAVDFIEEQREFAPADNPKFDAFVQDIIEIYPDLSEDDQDGDDERNLWDEGLDSEASYGNVKELVVNVDITEEDVEALVAAASRHGLRLYDEEGEYLHPVI
ncbi:MAG: hypothetical protein B7Y40_01040 [Gammaproteobacteria bacterium 28-57-27]|nr:MAG: hypothetical protein B7Y40_01040 [Gammaproteobacteria bacterium 28-57-27]